MPDDVSFIGPKICNLAKILQAPPADEPAPAGDADSEEKSASEETAESAPPEDTPADPEPSPAEEQIPVKEPIETADDTSRDIVEDPVEELKSDENAESSPADDNHVAEGLLAGGAALAAGGLIAGAMNSKSKSDEQEPLSSPKEPSSPRSERRKHRSSHHSTRSREMRDIPSRQLSSREKVKGLFRSLSKDRHKQKEVSKDKQKEAPRDDGHRRHRRSRESDGSLKLTSLTSPPKIPSPTKTRRPRHDSGVSAGSADSHERRRRGTLIKRTPEEQKAHDERKAWRLATKAKLAAEAESAKKDAPPVTARPATPVEALPPIFRRYSSSTRNSPDNALKLKGESVVKTPFMVDEQPHVKEVKEKIPIMARPRFSFDGERPVLAADSRRNTTGTGGSHDHHHHHSRSHRRERDDENRKTEEDREARRFRRESEKAAEIAKADVADSGKRASEKDDEDRRIRREERRRKREEAERTENIKSAGNERAGTGDRRRSERGGTADRRSGSERENEAEWRDDSRKERVHRHHSRREKEKEREKEREKEKKKGALSSFWSSAKKVFI